MRFVPSEDQRDFIASLDSLLSSSDPVAVARTWAAGDTGPGLKLWSRLAEQGVHALLVPEEFGGMGATPVELALAFEVLGRYAVPGPYVESVAFLPAALGDADPVAALAEGGVGTVAAPPGTPYALDADVAEHVFVADAELRTATLASAAKGSVDRSRRLFEVAAGEPAGATGDLRRAADLAALATAAQLLGCGERILVDSVTYVKQRRQFGREIGSYQAIKHHLADVRIALDFARPLLHGAALVAAGSGTDAVAGDRARDVSAAKIACAEAAYLASRAGLQVHGAIGYTQEFDLSVWLTKVRALVTAWGTPAHHRRRVLEAIVAEGGTR